MSAELKPCPDVIAWAEKDGDDWLIHNADSQLGQHIAKYQKEHHYKTLFPVFATRSPEPLLAEVREEIGQIQLLIEDEAYKVTAGQKPCKHTDALNEIHDMVSALLTRLDAAREG